MADLPGAAVKRLVVKHGRELRISASALQAAVDAAENYIARLAQAAAASAEDNKRKTIMDADIAKARQTIG